MKLLNLFLALSAALWATSCLESEQSVSGTGDAFVVCRKVGDNVVYGLSLNAYTYSEFEKVTVQGVTGSVKKNYTLSAKQGYKTSFYWETPEAEFSATPPQETVFTFTSVFSNGTSQVFQDILTDKILAIPTASAIVYNGSKDEIQVTWAGIENADTYAIALLDQDNKTIFSSSEQRASQSTTYTIGVSGSGWASTARPVAGKTYKLRIYAIDYESDINAYNMQALAFGDKEFVWGPSQL